MNDQRRLFSEESKRPRLPINNDLVDAMDEPPAISKTLNSKPPIISRRNFHPVTTTVPPITLEVPCSERLTTQFSGHSPTASSQHALAKVKYKPSRRPKLQTTFTICCLLRTDIPQKRASFHFHECDGISHNRRGHGDICTLGNGKIFTPVEFCMEMARAKVIKDERFRKMRTLMILHRGAIEQELTI